MRRTHWPAEPASPHFEPVRVLEVELSRPLPALQPSQTPAGVRYGRGLVFVRLDSEPLGLVDVELQDGLSSKELADAIWHSLADDIRAHERADGLPEPVALGAGGLPRTGVPRCISAREAFLRDAPSVTVLLPSRERPERLRRCLDSILALEYPLERLEIMVVDNVPRTDATRRLVEAYRRDHGDRVHYAREDAPGSASARNRGLQEVRTEIVAMTDDDVVVDRHWVTEVARTFTEHPRAACVSGLLLPMELDTPAQIWFEQYGGFSRGFRCRVFDRQHRPADEPLFPWTAGVFGTGNNFSFRTQSLLEIGGFDPALGNGTPALGGVDSEVLLRTILTGHEIVYQPRAVVHHAHRPDYEALCRQVYAYGTGLVAYYLKTLLARPRLTLDFARKLPAGVRWMLSPEAHVNKHKRHDYPAELTRLERQGMLYGPFAYAKSRRAYGRHQVPPLALD